MPGDPSHQTCYQGKQFGGLDRLGQVHLEARQDDLEPILRARVSRQCQGRGAAPPVSCQRTHLANQLKAIGFRHPDIAHQYVGALGLQQFNGLSRASGSLHDGTSILQEPLDQSAGVRLVVYYQYLDAREVQTLGGDR